MALRDKFELASQRAKSVRPSTPKAISVAYVRASGHIVIQLNSGVRVSFPAHAAQGLERARVSQLEDVEISPSGLGIHFPKLDADIYLPSILEGFLGSKRWMAARLGQAGGRSRSRAKQGASRSNGKLGGRPKTERQRSSALR